MFLTIQHDKFEPIFRFWILVRLVSPPYAPEPSNHHPWLENHDFSATELPLDLRLVCKLEFVSCGRVDNNRALYLSRFNRGGPTKFENIFIAKLRFLIIFNDFQQNSRMFKKFSRDDFKSLRHFYLKQDLTWVYSVQLWEALSLVSSGGLQVSISF